MSRRKGPIFNANTHGGTRTREQAKHRDMEARRYILTQPAAGLPAGTEITGPAVDVLVANGKAVPIEEKPVKPAKTKKK